MRLVVSVAGRRIATAEDELELKRRTIAALQVGGDFVSINTHHRKVEVLVSPGISFLIETVKDHADFVPAGGVGIETIAPDIDEFDDWGSEFGVHASTQTD